MLVLVHMSRLTFARCNIVHFIHNEADHSCVCCECELPRNFEETNFTRVRLSSITSDLDGEINGVVAFGKSRHGVTYFEGRFVRKICEDGYGYWNVFHMPTQMCCDMIQFLITNGWRMGDSHPALIAAQDFMLSGGLLDREVLDRAALDTMLKGTIHG